MSDLFLGLMSGTSVDALDIALCRFTPKLEIISRTEKPFDPVLRAKIHKASSSEPIALDDLLALEQAYTEFCADATHEFISQQSNISMIRAIGFHGQTLRHRPELGTSLQMGNPSLIAERTGIDVIADFRRRDLAAGGEGAPLVPAFHQYLVAEMERPLGLLNLGGIANLSIFNDDKSVLGFDSGPANTLMDHWIAKHSGASFDKNGAWAATGRVNNDLLDTLLNEPYFKRKPPKSTGRELFNLNWLTDALAKFAQLAPEDVQRTLLELTARTVAESIPCKLRTLVLCGGGAANSLLIDRLSQLLPATELIQSDHLGWPASHLEAVAFAWLAQQHILGLPGNLPEVTGAMGPRVLGAYYPAKLLPR